MDSANKSKVKFLLLLDALLHTNHANPRATPKLINDVETALESIFPQEQNNTISDTTIGRYIKSINASKLFHIETMKAKKSGYYCDKFLFDSAEFSVIAQALFQSPSISTKETIALLGKFMHRTDALGDKYLKIMMKQLSNTAPRRKTKRKILPIIQIILESIWYENKISFTYYINDTNEIKKRHKHIDEKTGQPKKYIVSPYFLVWHSDECYLIANLDSLNEKGRKTFTHFKVSRIANDIMRLTMSPVESISLMDEYKHYYIPEKNKCSKTNETVDFEKLSHQTALKSFALDRYMREHLWMFHSMSAPIKLRLYFTEDSVRLIQMRFDLDSRALKLNPISGRYAKDGKQLYSAYIRVQENEGLYVWLMQMGSRIFVKEPASIREKLKQRLQDALDVNAYLENN
ncbi:hypothetical protein SELR_pSRC102340 (plasmid) [Selenomonas ruminantium subsp. lactilytica TAM6421]|uniref:Uncharacterized protein n=1 Tax=Selenomonas ruminantium subsp. lactilytica (strain NBRC 103574 / TAM6421) TaxID=927704 RepID=I0GWA4_SELRL|nr:WYL domain-containing protein [Selenomonas ruminantium]BAL85041.1 hypothetical protein SELR_pSRC102340 [Selenomonas ruminantium subsp. lactilytica TAM6421]